ncbi:MAG: fibronectin type III domain-containing protein [Eubacterium sp.]
MKKLLSVLLSIIMLVSCASISSFSAMANTKKTATDISLNQTVDTYVDSVSREYWLKFVPDYSGCYEFVCTSPVYSGMVLGSIFDASEEVLMMTAGSTGNGDFITAAELNAGDTYYFVLETDGSIYSTGVTVRPHNHLFNQTENYPAIFDANDSGNNVDGGNYVYCAYCSEYLTNAVYYAPAKMSISTKKVAYNAKAKTTTVTVTDRLGNVIPSSEYKVTYKNNTKPGTATVIVTFNNNNYSGSMKSSFLIIPKKATLSSVKSPKKNQIKVSWKKDTTVSGYQVQYSTSKKFYKSKTKTVTVSKKNTSKIFSKLKSNKEYYVRVRSYKTIQGKKYYGAWSSVKSVKIK